MMTSRQVRKTVSRLGIAALTALSPILATTAEARPGGGGGGARASGVSSARSAPSASVSSQRSTSFLGSSAKSLVPAAGLSGRPPLDSRVLSTTDHRPTGSAAALSDRSVLTRTPAVPLRPSARALSRENDILSMARSAVIEAIRLQDCGRLSNWFNSLSICYLPRRMGVTNAQATPSRSAVAAYLLRPPETNAFTASVDSYALKSCFDENIGQPAAVCFDRTGLSPKTLIDGDRSAALLTPIPFDPDGQAKISARLGFALGPIPSLD